MAPSPRPPAVMVGPVAGPRAIPHPRGRDDPDGQWTGLPRVRSRHAAAGGGSPNGQRREVVSNTRVHLATNDFPDRSGKFRVGERVVTDQFEGLPQACVVRDAEDSRTRTTRLQSLTQPQECTTVHSMDAGGSELAALVGTRLRAARTAHGWTLDQMADRSGVSRRMVVLVEKGQTNPSVTTLLLLSDALGIGLPTLVAEREGIPSALTRRGDGAQLWSSPAGGSAVLLAGTPSPDVLELWHWALAPHDEHASTAHTAGTKEILHVVSGVLRVTAGPDDVVLEPGDAYAFAGDQPHAYRNPGTVRTTFTLAVFEPDVGTTSRLSDHG